MSRTQARPSPPAKNTRLIMILAALGALVVLSTSVGLNWSVDDGSEIGGPGRAGGTPRAVFSAKPGKCLNWTEPDASDIRQVTCTEPHLFEVTGTADLHGQFGSNAGFPNAEQWQQIKQERCMQVSQQYLGGRLDPDGRLSVGAFTPSEHGWADGERVLHCGVQQSGPSGMLFRFRGAAGQIDQSNIYSVGRCLGINGTALWDPVDCAQPHSAEITGVADLAEKFPQGYPAEGDQDQFLVIKCAELTTRYVGNPAAATDKGLVIYWDTLSQDSWNAGSRHVNCKVSAQLPDRSGLAPVTGSVRGEVRVGNTPAPKNTAAAEPRVPAPGSR